MYKYNIFTQTTTRGSIKYEHCLLPYNILCVHTCGMMASECSGQYARRPRVGRSNESASVE